MAPTDRLTPVDEALDRIRQQAEPVRAPAAENVPLSEALGRVLSHDIPVPMDVPPADNSAADGYAVRSGESGDTPRPVRQRIAAGDSPAPLEPGTVARIFTGATIPDGADAVVMQEHATITEAGMTTERVATPGQNIRPRGQDLGQGAQALAAGTRLRPQELGLLASIGIAEVSVRRPLRVAILTTGNELTPPGRPLPPGAIYNTNRDTFRGLLNAMGCEIVDTGDVADTFDDTRHALEQAAGEADLILSSGGVSVGDEDHVRTAMDALGQIDLWRLAIKPGKPLASGWINDTPMLGLPGNPAAVLVTFAMIVAPLIRQLRGQTPTQVQPLFLPAGFDHDRQAPRREYLRVQVHNEGQTTALFPHPNQSSGMLSSACWADGLAVVPEETTITRGEPVAYYPFSELLR
ncbi:molybdopterin molybdenumtransferase MoeA [Tamilnaduibacter salinus]|uniref:Molybdopterin molybdenumtransferase n=1 Tax=Tamilnaduibacter salinus TaxID=1484056 RepID=A0A2A2I1W0_9GAMM|nr:gephyrin-like molybdotransferase Glp [Tamilnaduibacter salinus]PAV25408.1 molybdopterin molybdenumtransferase MoeA [Tamilnaduibacter salinus]